MAMSPAARAWAEALPLTHFVRVLVDHGVRGPQPGRDVHDLAVLAAFVIGSSIVAAWPLHRLVRGRRRWQAS